MGKMKKGLFKKNNIQLDDSGSGDIPVQEKNRGKMSRKKKVMIGVFICVLGLFVFNMFNRSGQKPMVMTVAAKRQDISQTLSTSGTVISNKILNCFAPVSAKIGEICVKKGETVKKGEPVILYDQEALAELKRMTELNLQANSGGYQDSMEKNQKQQALYSEAATNLDILKQQITDTQNRIDALKKQMEEKENELAYHGTNLEISRLEWADQPESEEYQNLLKLIQRNQYEQKNHPELRRLREEIEQNTQLLNEYKAYESEMKAQKSSSEGGKLSAGGQSQLRANTEMQTIKLENTLEAIGANEQGVAAEFNGVVTLMEAVEGKVPQEGELLFRLESLEDVVVSLSVSKYDLEKLKVGQKASLTIAGKSYQGEISRIEQMATKNSNGAAVVGAYIKITNPDQDIFLGVEAKAVVSTGEVQGVITVPIEAVNTDVSGEFVYVVENGIVVKKMVETGLSTDLEIEITKGIEEGDQVITDMGTGVLEGMEVLAQPAA